MTHTKKENMTKTTHLTLLLTSCTLLFAACTEDTDNTNNTGSTFTGSDTLISELSDAQIETLCMEGVSSVYQLQVSFECAAPAFEAGLTNMDPPMNCESDVVSCINMALPPDFSAPCEPATEDEETSPSCMFQECITSITARRDAGCMATEALVVTCTNDSVAEASFTPAQFCSGEAFAAFFNEDESSAPASCTEVEMICPDPEE